jgi:hypothetical protein
LIATRWGLDKKDDVRKFVIRRTVTKEGKQDYTKAPKIQRLVTPQLGTTVSVRPGSSPSPCLTMDRARTARSRPVMAPRTDFRKFVIRRTVTKEGKQDYTKAPKIQRLVTPQRLPTDLGGTLGAETLGDNGVGETGELTLALLDDGQSKDGNRTVTKEGKQDYTKAPKIQRLVTPQRLQRKRQRVDRRSDGSWWHAWGRDAWGQRCR